MKCFYCIKGKLSLKNVFSKLLLMSQMSISNSKLGNCDMVVPIQGFKVSSAR